MDKKAWTILGFVCVLLIGTGAFIAYLQHAQRLGEPGLKVVEQPIHDPEGNVVGAHSVYLPAQIPGYRSEELPVTRLELDWLPKDTVYGRRLYRADDGFEAMTSVVLMGADRTSIHQPQYCLTGQGWSIEKSEVATIPVFHPHRYDLPVMKLTATREHRAPNGQRMVLRGVYVYWFVADNQMTADHLQRMWWMARDLVFTGVLQRWAYVTYFSICMPGSEEATFNRMKELIADSVPEFQLVAGQPAAELSHVGDH